MSGWQHTTLDYDPATDGDEEEWAHRLAEQGSGTWMPGPALGSRSRAGCAGAAYARVCLQRVDRR